MKSSISVAEFAGILSTQASPCIIDVRRSDEFAECHVIGARLFPLDVLDPSAVLEAVKPPAGETIWILCKSGMRAGKAADRFRAAGFENVCVVEGGTDACAAAGLPCEGVV